MPSPQEESGIEDRRRPGTLRRTLEPLATVLRWEGMFLIAALGFGLVSALSTRWFLGFVAMAGLFIYLAWMRAFGESESSRLFRLSCILEVPVSYFFEGLQEDGTVSGVPTVSVAVSTEPNHMERRETLELVRAYYRIDDQNVRRRIFDLVKSLGGVRRDSASEKNDEPS